MSYLDSLDISNRVIPVPPRRQKADTIDHRRAKLIASTEEQIELVNLALQGKPLQLQRKRGHKVTTVRPRLWWNVQPDGSVLTQVRYTKTALNLAARGTTIEAGSLSQLPKIYKTVIKAIKSGELDQAIMNAGEMAEQ
ncbi:MAG: hypothetical protein HKN11_16705 [Rhizobiales bacterium]|nr:hypothetical protein [Hyphomicrobiales bacterium]